MSPEEVVEQADEGELPMVKRVLIDFQRFKVEPKDDFLPLDEKLFDPYPPPKFPEQTPKRIHSN